MEQTPYEHPPTQQPYSGGPVQPQKFAADLIVGIVTTILFGCCLGFGVIGMAGQSMEGSQASVQGSMPMQLLGLGGMAAIVAGGIGTIMGRRWGFLSSAVGCTAWIAATVINLATTDVTAAMKQMQSQSATRGTTLTEDQIAMMINVAYAVAGLSFLMIIALLVYSGMRLTGRIGPAPR